ncbi:AraC family transcriptional regulator [Hydrogenophaga crassostreae]|uniref:AraC family transcriptional regulator n=1 Tax=Hydrogenophaga crassostreae TaxID=1763535 RepID=A0A162SUF9_9BURK|nr:AraC family transcriptional regulator [Hydrogenophaga crassostreae]AOW12568.1 AraC family transcriptional regulator [Hydrogenophaga crassostreae]OAD40437.1 AraC family transcriptional regulator [Hydrogenophaga crassostreae]
MSVIDRNRSIPRQLKPELEHDYARSPDLGYEAPDTTGFVRCLSHGFPTPLARWHCHDEYELHLITETSGKVFVGDWIGQFQPGHLVLTGPRLPHNWLSLDTPEGGVALRDLVIQFQHAPLMQSAAHIAELNELLPLLERARHGVEFFGMGERSERHWHRIKQSQGLRRLTAFFDLMSDLAACTDYRLLSSVQLQSDGSDASIDQIHVLVTRITDHLSETHSAAALAAELGMSESRFSRFFRKATGNTFTDFVNRVRISRACQLLMDTDQQITHICYEVGFNNVANFNRRFLESKGLTPSEFRKQSLTRFRGAA